MTTEHATTIARRINGQSVHGMTAARITTITTSAGQIQPVVRVTLATGAVRVVSSVAGYTALANDPR